MKIGVCDYVHGSNGMALEIVPETDVEKGILKAFFHHGDLVLGNGDKGIGFYIRWNPKKDRELEQP